MNRISKRLICLALALVLLLGLTACGGSGNTNEAKPEDATQKDTVVIAAGREPPTLDTMNQNYMLTCISTLLTHNCLMRVGEGLIPEPDLAESYENISDTEWLFHLHKNVKFHDGTDMTAEDVVATLERAATISQAQQYVLGFEKIEAVDEYTVKITTKTPISSLLMDLTNQQVAILSKEDIDAAVDFNTVINGTGPYRFVEYISGDKLEYEANANYFNPEETAAIKHMIWRFIPEGAARTIALEAGDVDYIWDVETMDVAKLEENPATKVLHADSVALTYLLMNNEVAPFDNVNFRKAISAAIDRESLVKVALNGFGKPAISCAPMGYASSTDEKATATNLDKAKEYLAASGVDPKTVTMPLVCSNNEAERAGAIIQANLAELGITVKLETMDNATWLAKYNTGDYVSGITQLAQRSMQQWLTTIYHSKFINASNGARVNDPKVDELLDLAAITIDPDKNNAVLSECVSYLNDLSPVAPLYSVSYVKAYAAGLEGANCNATGAAYYHWLKWS